MLAMFHERSCVLGLQDGWDRFVAAYAVGWDGGCKGVGTGFEGKVRGE